MRRSGRCARPCAGSRSAVGELAARRVPVGHHVAALVRHRHVHDGDCRPSVDEVGHLAVQVGHVAGQRGRAVLHVAVQIPRRARRPSSSGSRGSRRPSTRRSRSRAACRSAARTRACTWPRDGPVVEAVAERRIDLRALEVARHLGQPARLVERRRAAVVAEGAPHRSSGTRATRVVKLAIVCGPIGRRRQRLPDLRRPCARS